MVKMSWAHFPRVQWSVSAIQLFTGPQVWGTTGGYVPLFAGQYGGSVCWVSHSVHLQHDNRPGRPDCKEFKGSDT